MMKNLMQKVLHKIAEGSYNTSVKSVNKVSEKGLFQQSLPKQMNKLKKNH